MKNKDDIYFHLEFFLTVFLLYLVISLLGEIVSNYRLYIIFGLICGFCFSWFNRGKPSLIPRFLINLATLGGFLWIIYSVINSSLFYTEVVLICIRGVFIFEIIFSFSAYLPEFLTFIQLLSIPLFMGYPVLARSHNTISFILILGYVICWFVILKVKLYGFFKPESERKSLRYYSIYILVIFFLICVFVSWMLISKFPLGRMKEGGFLPAESLEPEVVLKTSEKEYYDLEDGIQEEITNLTLNFKSADDRYEVLALFSSLIKEPADIMEVKKAEQGLIDYLKRPGSGIGRNEGEELASAIKNYLDEKIIFSLQKTKENIMDILKRNAFDITERISILSRINKIQHSSSYQQMSKYGEELQKIIDNSSVYIDVKRELKEHIRKLKEWKSLEFYRKKSDYLKKNINSLDKQFKKEFADLNSGINGAERLSEFEEIEEKIDKLKETATPQTKYLIEEMEKLLDLKSEMSLSEKNRRLKEKLESANLSEYKLKDFKEEADTIKDTEKTQDFLADFSKFQEEIKKDGVNISQEIKELSEIKIHLFIKEKIEKIKDMLKDSILPDESAKEFLEKLKKLELTKKIEDLISDIKGLETDIEKFSNQGFILKKTKDNLISTREDIKNLLLFKLKVEEGTKRKEVLNGINQIADRKDWEELLEESSLKRERKETLKQLTKELSKAETTPQVKDIQEAAEEEIEGSLKEGVRKEEAERLKESFQSMAEIKRMFIIEKDHSDLRKKIEEEKLKPKAQELKEKSIQAEEGAYWQICILPSRLVIPVDSSVSLKTIAIYNKIFVKDISSELEWFSSHPYVAGVDEAGTVHSLSKGKTKISAKYKGINSQEVEVAVVDKISSEIDKTINRELVR